MLTKLKVQHYKSLFDTDINLEPLTVFIGPNGSGKSNICESLVVLSDFLTRLTDVKDDNLGNGFFVQLLEKTSNSLSNIQAKFWHGELDYLSFTVGFLGVSKPSQLAVRFNYSTKIVSLEFLGRRCDFLQEENNFKSKLRSWLIDSHYQSSLMSEALRKVNIYDFAPSSLSNESSSTGEMGKTGQGIAYALADILFSNRKSFDELEERLRILVPNIQRISLLRGKSQTFSLQLVDKYSENPIPASDISDGTLRILAFLAALYQEDTPSIICFEEIENGVHPWLLHKMMELLKLVSTEGITGKPVQVLITTHSPVLLNYVEPHQVRAVELDNEGKTQVHNLPTDSVRFQKALEAYDGSLGELWFTNQFGGNPV
jgi:predicted ATPase